MTAARGGLALQDSVALERRRQPVFELCAETITACIAAREGGAARIEFCRELDAEGLTPDDGALAEAIRVSGLPVHMLLRPRAGDFVYTDGEFARMREEMRRGMVVGAAGFALGLLRADGRVDVERTRALVEMAEGREVTFHRAFDVTASPEDALEDVIVSGCGRVLTSGGAADVFAGAAMLERLVAQARGRLEIAVGGGLRIANAAAVARQTGARHFHGSLRQVEDGPGGGVRDAGAVTSGGVVSMVRELAAGMRQRD